MSERDAFDSILASLHEAALDRGRWSSATALIDDALRTHGSSMVCGDGDSEENIRIHFVWSFVHGQRDRATGARILPDLLPPGRTGAAPAASARQPAVPHDRPLQRRGTEDVADLQRAAGAAATSATASTCAWTGPRAHASSGSSTTPSTGTAGRPRSSTRSGASCPLSVRPCACSRRWPGPGRSARRWRSCSTPPGWASSNSTGARGSWRRTTPARAMLRSGKGLYDKKRIPPRSHAGGRCRTAGAVDPCAAEVRGPGRRRLDDDRPRRSPAAAGGARQPGGPAGDGLARLAGGGAGAGHRPGAANPHRSGRGGGGARAHGEWRAGWRCCWPKA